MSSYTLLEIIAIWQFCCNIYRVLSGVCSVDVLHLLGSACSGKEQCDYPVLNEELHNLNPCDELESYLRVEYDCIKGKYDWHSILLSWRSHTYVYVCGFLIFSNGSILTWMPVTTRHTSTRSPGIYIQLCGQKSWMWQHGTPVADPSSSRTESQCDNG